MTNEPVPIQDYIILVVPPDVDVDTPEIKAALEGMAQKKMIEQYRDKPPKALVVDPVEWLITSDWREVEEFQPAHDCAACRAGNDQAVAFLKEHPDRRLALGNLSYWEAW